MHSWINSHIFLDEPCQIFQPRVYTIDMCSYFIYKVFFSSDILPKVPFFKCSLNAGFVFNDMATRLDVLVLVVWLWVMFVFSYIIHVKRKKNSHQHCLDDFKQNSCSSILKNKDKQVEDNSAKSSFAHKLERIKMFWKNIPLPLHWAARRPWTDFCTTLL